MGPEGVVAVGSLEDEAAGGWLEGGADPTGCDGSGGASASEGAAWDGGALPMAGSDSTGGWVPGGSWRMSATFMIWPGGPGWMRRRR